MNFETAIKLESQFIKPKNKDNLCQITPIPIAAPPFKF